MKLEIEISELAERMLGEDAPSKVSALVEQEALRLWHIERSKPKAKKPVGRPAQTPEQKMATALGGQLREVYARLKSMYGPDYEKAFGEQEAKLEELIEAQNLNGLIEMNTEQPWVIRRKA
jgi:hypothetical protein